MPRAKRPMSGRPSLVPEPRAARRTRRLYLLRHAKSSRDEERLEDHDRPLTKRGRRDAGAITRHLESTSAPCNLVLCSTALRARETAEPILDRLKPQRVVLDRAFYLASAASLLERLRGLGSETAAVLVIGHNPGLHELALALVDRRSAGALPSRAGKFPTAAFAEFRFEGDWRELGPGRARLTRYVTPRALAAAPRSGLFES